MKTRDIRKEIEQEMLGGIAFSVPYCNETEETDEVDRDEDGEEEQLSFISAHSVNFTRRT